MSSPLKDISGKVFDEIEFRRLLEQSELLDATELLADIGHYQWDYANDRLISCSQGYARIHNTTVKDILEQHSNWENCLAHIHPDDRASYEATYESQRESGHFSIEYRLLRDGEARWIREVGVLKTDGRGRIKEVFGLLQDITEKKEYEKGLQQARDLLEIKVKNRTRELADTITQLENEINEREKISTELESKNAELERFAYTVSHDLKTPLVTIKGFLGLLDKDIACNDKQAVADDIVKINHAADTMVTLLDDLLELSRIGRVVGDIETLALDSIVQKALATVETQIQEKGVEIVVGDLPLVIGDKLRLVEVYQNLIENSLKFTGDQDHPTIEIGSQKYRGRTCLFVRDNGIGIDNEYHELVFGLFERLNLEIDGTGVGLALVKRIIEVHGGKIWIESREAEGCTFWFSLPTAE